MLDTGGVKIFLVDEMGDILPDAVALQVVALLACRQARRGKVGVPVTASRNIEKIAARFGMEVIRSRTLPRSLMEIAARDGVAFAGDGSGGFVFPGFQPAFDGMFAAVKIMELLAAEGRGAPISSKSAHRADPPEGPVRLGAQGIAHADADHAREGEAEPVRGRGQGVRGRRLGPRLPEPGRGARARATGKPW
jgi:phosphomannomutase